MVLAGGTNTNSGTFVQAFHEFCLANRVVSEFARLHPWRDVANVLEASSILENRDIVYIDLNLPIEEILRSFTHGCRKGVSKANRLNVQIELANDSKSVSEFYRIYHDTMVRVQALSKYHFPISYFELFQQLLPDNSRFVLAKHNGCVVAASLYLFDRDNLFAYLGGGDAEHQELRPRNKLIFEMIKWGKANGKQRLVLGGGYRPQDGVFKFKAGFSPLRALFKVYKKVHIPDVYDTLCEEHRKNHRVEPEDEGFFPAYRSPGEDEKTQSGYGKDPHED
jgi:serine/alanine adding enzyme